MIRRTMAGLAVMTVALAVGAAAHEGHSHTQRMMGTVKAVHAEMNHVEITTTKGTEGFYVDAKTKYLRGTTRLALADVAPGARVVVKARTEAGKKIANEVRLSGAAPAASPAPQNRPGHSH